MNIDNKLGIEPKLIEIKSYKASNGVLYENYETALAVEKNIQLNKMVEKYLLDTTIRCCECENYIYVQDEFVEFAKYLMTQLES